MSKFLNDKYAGLEVYTPGEQPKDGAYIKLNTNESPYPPSPGVLKAAGEAAMADLRLYPDPECTALKEKLAELYDVTPKNIYLANGSDDILNFAFMAFGGADREILFPEISYGFYSVFGDLHGVPYRKVPLQADFSIRVSDYTGDSGAKGGMIVIANPNAPTGLALSLAEIREILDANPDKVVLIDEAYVDFGGQTAAPLTREYDNLLVVQTFSKSRSMAGARLGLAIACPELIGDLDRIKYSTNPYNINRITMAAAEAAVDENGYYVANCQRIMATRAWTTAALEALGFAVVPSLTNFVFAKHDRVGGQQLYEELKKRHILVRHFSDPKITDYNRITIGTAEEMATLIETIKTILEEEQ